MSNVYGGYEKVKNLYRTGGTMHCTRSIVMYEFMKICIASCILIINAYAQKCWNDDDNDNAFKMGTSKSLPSIRC